MSIQDLSRMGAARVSVSKFEGVPCIYKQGASDVEIGFYQWAAPIFEGVNTPKLFQVNGNDLIIEHIPNKVSLEELQASKSTFKQLAWIHQYQYQPTFAVKKHEWQSCSTELALNILNVPDITRDSIRTLQALSSELFEHSCLVSGDTNDGNWGIRANGDLVLFDWERFGFGSPAIDLAPLVRGLGTLTDYKSVAEKYLRYGTNLSTKQLERHLVIAKCWIVIEVVNILVSRNKPEASMYIDWYRERVPAWLTSVEKAL